MRIKASMAATAATAVVALGCAFSGGMQHAEAFSGHAKDAKGKRFECSNKTLRGTYGVRMEGTRPIPGGGGLESVIGVVIRTYDGAGNFTQIDNIKGATSGIVPDRPGAGTYTVNADCSGTTLFEPGPGVLIEERFVIVDYGHEVHSITTTPQPLMVTAVAKRVGWR